MTISATFDPTLSRVQVTGTVPGLLDTFSRVVTGGWGTTDTGETWTTDGGSASDYSVDGALGHQSCSSLNLFRSSILSTSFTDVDYSVEFQTDDPTLGDAQIFEFVTRWVDAANYYCARVTFEVDDSVTLSIRRRVAGVQTTLVSETVAGLTHASGTVFVVRHKIEENQLYAKVWSGSEPDGWTSSTADGTFSAAGPVVLRFVLSSGATNVLPVVGSYDDLTTRGDARVQRSTDQVTWTTIRGGLLDGSTGTVFALDDYEFTADVENFYRLVVNEFVETDSVTPTLDAVWLKSIGRPFLNQALNCVGNPSPIVRPSRGSAEAVVSRSLPVARTELHGSRELDLVLVFRTTDERVSFNTMISTGDPLFFHTPAGHALPTMYVTIGDTTEERPLLGRRCNDDWRRFTLPLKEVAAPGASVVGSSGTWQTVVNTYATWQDVIDDKDTWLDLLDLVGSPGEVIVP